ncbi:hypothetical protein [Pedobacter nutrimenti]|uniref:hypothetical protein n=1 Tax=Pedobacter nutrimenti TaxID=1241337 RepID=UPI00292E633C|nr:hypothetical protein [Pedobacter nutrimenti]
MAGLPKMKLFNLDLHATVIKDLIDLFEGIGHQVDHWSISSHSWIHGWAMKDVDVVNQFTWQHLNEEMCRRFYERYKDELSSYDAFIVTHTPSFALLYTEFNKPIITVASTRYEAPFSGSKRHWEWLNSSLHDLSRRQLIARVANNKYDQHYCQLFTGLSWTHIPSYCGHMNVHWNPESPSFLVDSRILSVRLKNVSVIHKKSLGRFEWTDLVKYAGIIVIPYNASVMSVFEYYTACIPLFFPSRKFCMELYENFSDLGVLSDLSWSQISGVDGGSVLRVEHNDPNNYKNLEVVEHWLGYADWYDTEWMPYITHFDSFADLEEKINSTDLEGISEKMRLHNEIRKQKIEMLWDKELNILMNNK